MSNNKIEPQDAFRIAFETYANDMCDATMVVVEHALQNVKPLLFTDEYNELHGRLQHLKRFHGSGGTSWDTVQDIIDVMIAKNWAGAVQWIHEEDVREGELPVMIRKEPLRFVNDEGTAGDDIPAWMRGQQMELD
jgi:hypothetical protein